MYALKISYVYDALESLAVGETLLGLMALGAVGGDSFVYVTASGASVRLCCVRKPVSLFNLCVSARDCAWVACDSLTRI